MASKVYDADRAHTESMGKSDSKLLKCNKCCALCCIIFIAVFFPIAFLVVPDSLQKKLQDDIEFNICSMKACQGAGGFSTCNPCAGKVDTTCGANVLARTGSTGLIGAEMWISVYNPTDANAF
eukprot:4772810-Prymnesium_polylepis.1